MDTDFTTTTTGTADDADERGYDGLGGQRHYIAAGLPVVGANAAYRRIM